MNLDVDENEREFMKEKLKDMEEQLPEEEG